MKKHKFTTFAAISLTVGVIVVSIANTKSASAGYMDDYFRNGMTIKLVTPKGFNVNLPYPTNGGMINTFEPDNTDDWKFVVIRNSADGFKLKRVGTNHLITTKDFPAQNLTPLEAWQDVGGEDKFQTWVATPTRPGFFAICLKAQRDQCMNVPNSTNRTRLTTDQFDANDQDQMFSAVPINSPPRGYRSNIESVLRNFFSNTANTNKENWSQKTITEMWDRVGGESAQFPGGAYPDRDIWQVDMPSDVYGVYQDLSNAIFGSVKAVTTGYAYDYGYYPSEGAHSALDIGASNGTSLKALVNGTVVDNRPQYLKNGSFNGYWIAIDELDANGQKTGRRWWYGHLATSNVNVGSKVTAGQTVLGTVGQNHLHLGVVSTYKTYTPSMYGVEVRNGKTGNYSADVQDVLNRTMSPLQAYWKSRNGIKE